MFGAVVSPLISKLMQGSRGNLSNIQSGGKEAKKAIETTAPISNKKIHLRHAHYKLEEDVQRTI